MRSKRRRRPGHPRGTTRHLPEHSLRHARMEKALHPTHANRKLQQHGQNRRRPPTRLVPGARGHRQQHGPSRLNRRSQPTPSQKLPLPKTISRKQRQPPTAPRQRHHAAQQTRSHQRNHTPRATGQHTNQRLTHPTAGALSALAVLRKLAGSWESFECEGGSSIVGC